MSLLDIVLAVDGSQTAFRCTEIRQRGPAASPRPGAYRRPCGIARAMWRAEDAWRGELAATSVADVLTELVATVAARTAPGGAEWIQESRPEGGPEHEDLPHRRTGVVGTRALPALVAAGHQVTAVARGPRRPTSCVSWAASR